MNVIVYKWFIKFDYIERQKPAPLDDPGTGTQVVPEQQGPREE